jgi:gas vesicle protein
MGQDTDALSTTPADIEATRADLSRNLDELSDKVSPQRVVQRRKDAARQSLTSVKDKVMGSAQDIKSRTPSLTGGTSGTSGTGGTGGNVKGNAQDAAQDAIGTVQSATAGNPLVAGAVAFGAGMLISALIPATKAETQAAHRVVDAAKEHGQPLIEEAKSVGQDIGKDLGDSAKQAAQQVKTQAQDSADNLKQEGQSSVNQVKDEAPTS